jgi:hypothetical protein
MNKINQMNWHTLTGVPEAWDDGKLLKIGRRGLEILHEPLPPITDSKLKTISTFPTLPAVRQANINSINQNDPQWLASKQAFPLKQSFHPSILDKSGFSIFSELPKRWWV